MPSILGFFFCYLWLPFTTKCLERLKIMTMIHRWWTKNIDSCQSLRGMRSFNWLAVWGKPSTKTSKEIFFFSSKLWMHHWKSLMNQQDDIEKNKQAAQAILNNENIKKELESIILQIPKSKKELFDYPINWTLFATVTQNESWIDFLILFRATFWIKKWNLGW